MIFVIQFILRLYGSIRLELFLLILLASFGILP